MNKLNWVNILARHLGCKEEDLPAIEITFQEFEDLPTIEQVFQEFENLQHDCVAYTQSGLIPIDHTVH